MTITQLRRDTRHIVILDSLFTMTLMMMMMFLAAPGHGTQWPGSYWDIPGTFCSASWPRLQCCQGRRDNCGLSLLNTTCYCDTFCNRSGVTRKRNADTALSAFQDCQL